MSLRLSRVSLARVAGILICGSTFVALSGCVHRSPAVDAPSPAERVTVGNGQRPNDEQGLRYFPGVNVIRTPTGGFLLRILSGLVGDGQLLYVIDERLTPVDPSRGIDWLKPEDILQINVLKDPAETAVYGPPGVNGVILITTKEGMRLRKRAMPRM
jgi:TonB-dependent SusC/RagA subfamily outer membrane receptor